jgi:hypothetical protein
MWRPWKTTKFPSEVIFRPKITENFRRDFEIKLPETKTIPHFEVFDITKIKVKITDHLPIDILLQLKRIRANEYYPAVLILYNDDESIHNAMAIESSPIGQSLTATRSAENFRTMIDVCFDSYGCSVTKGDNFRIFHKINVVDFDNLFKAISLNVRFAEACSKTGASVGTFFTVTTRKNSHENVCMLCKAKVGGFQGIR